MQKLHILKLTDPDDSTSDPQYYTIKVLRENIINVWYDLWGENREEPQSHTKEQIIESDECLWEYLNDWRFELEIILTLTEEDFSHLLTTK